MMDLDFLSRVRKTTIIIGVPLAIVISFYWGLSVGGGWVAGIVWSLVNLHFIGSLVKKVITAGDRNVPGIVITMFIKFPVLYAAGFLMPRMNRASDSLALERFGSFIWLPLAVLVGGQIGSRVSVRVLSGRWIKSLTGVLVISVGLRLLWQNGLT